MSGILDKTILEQLKCSTCKNYISFGPVTQTSDGHNCGRCSANGNEISTFFEIFAKNSLFPCRYEVNGCTAKMAYGEEMINHEKICEYRQSSCPVIDGNECEWNGPAITSFEHCLNDHKECTVVENNNFEFNVNLRESVINKRSIMKRKNGEVLLLHLMYSEEMGLSINVRSFIYQKMALRYTLILKSPDEKNRMELESKEIDPCDCSKPNLKWIPFHTLCCLDKSTISIIIKVERAQNAVVSKCDNCEFALTTYILKCSKNHQFCNKCSNIEQKCIICSDCLQFCSNYNAMEIEEGIFGCRNVLYGCKFFSNLRELEKHEEKCRIDKCLLETCHWRGVYSKFWVHILAKHNPARTDKIIIENKDIKSNVYFLLLDGSCEKFSNNHNHIKCIYFVQLIVDDTKDIIKLLVNYEVFRGTAISSYGKIKIAVGDNTVCKSDIGKITGLVLDRSCQIQFPRSLLKQDENLTIRVVNYKLIC